MDNSHPYEDSRKIQSFEKGMNYIHIVSRSYQRVEKLHGLVRVLSRHAEYLSVLSKTDTSSVLEVAARWVP